MIKASSGLEILGDNYRPLIGGYASFYIRNKYDKDSNESIEVITSNGETKIINIKVIGNKNGN